MRQPSSPRKGPPLRVVCLPPVCFIKIGDRLKKTRPACAANNPADLPGLRSSAGADVVSGPAGSPGATARSGGACAAPNCSGSSQASLWQSPCLRRDRARQQRQPAPEPVSGAGRVKTGRLSRRAVMSDVCSASGRRSNRFDGDQSLVAWSTEHRGLHHQCWSSARSDAAFVRTHPVLA